MATPKKIWYMGASYHITARGNHRNDIFRDESDFNNNIERIFKIL